MNLPADDFILISVLNTALRDKYCSLAELCEEEELDFDEVVSRAERAGFVYDEAANAFKAQ